MGKLLYLLTILVGLSAAIPSSSAKDITLECQQRCLTSYPSDERDRRVSCAYGCVVFNVNDCIADMTTIGNEVAHDGCKKGNLLIQELNMGHKDVTLGCQQKCMMSYGGNDRDRRVSCAYGCVLANVDECIDRMNALGNTVAIDGCKKAKSF